jgi:hypothetical protein
MEIPTWLGVTCLVLLAGLLAFVIFAFRQGLKVRRLPENVPPERLTGA